MPTLSLMLGLFGGSMAKVDIAKTVTELLEEFCEGKELEVYRVQFKKEGPDFKLKVFLDKPIGAENEYVDINECEAATRYLGEKLDEIDIIDRSYTLEVSSPGLDRELIKESDFTRFAGREVGVKLFSAINGLKNYEGTLVGLKDGIVTINVNGKDLEVPRDKISKINLAVIF